jgi:DedD protein
MDEGLKRRLIGAAVLASLAVIFVPMLFEEPPVRAPELPPLPEAPPQRDFASEMLREEVPAITPLVPRSTADVEPTPTPEGEDPQPRTGLSAWVVQVGSFSSRDNAEQLVAKLRNADLPTPDPELVDIRGKRYYRVKVGPVIERAEADALLPRVSEVAGTQAKVRSYP